MGAKDARDIIAKNMAQIKSGKSPETTPDSITTRASSLDFGDTNKAVPVLPEKEENLLAAIRSDYRKFGYTTEDAEAIVITLGNILARRKWRIRRHVVTCSHCQAEVEAFNQEAIHNLETRGRETAKRIQDATEEEFRRMEEEEKEREATNDNK